MRRFSLSVRKNQRICGVDEAGRGALAGPLVAAAVILPCYPRKIAQTAKTKLRDGKLLSSKQRNRIFKALKRLKTEIWMEVVTSRQINNHGIGWANREIVRRLIRKIVADEYIVDGKLRIGRIRGKTDRIRSIVDADATIPTVILAGIAAKVYRDRLMRQLHRQFPRYHWHSNMGYGTKCHIQAIQSFGLTYYHRNIFVTTALSPKSRG